MRVLLFAPNGGASLSQGGGTRVLLGHAARLVAMGHEVALAGFHALPLPELTALHDVLLPPEVRVYSDGHDALYRWGRRLPLKLSPYGTLVTGSFRDWVDRVFAHFRPDAVWFHDDIPKAAAPHARRTRSFLYVHFPFGGRDPAIVPELEATRSVSEAINDRLLSPLSPVVDRPTELAEEVWANSRVTTAVVERLWSVRPSVVPPVVALPPSVSEKRRSVLAVGTFSKGKNFEAVVDAFLAARPEGWSLTLMGHARDASYVARLRRRLGGLSRRGIESSLVVDASPPQLDGGFRSAALFVHPAIFEPFGIASLEAMAHGAVPLVHSGGACGAWTDLLDHGRFGHGFASPEELSTALLRLTSMDLSRGAREARARAIEFTREAESSLQEGLGRLSPPGAHAR